MILEDIDEEKYPEIIEEYFGGEFDKDDQFYYTKVFHRILKEIQFLPFFTVVTLFLDFREMVWRNGNRNWHRISSPFDKKRFRLQVIFYVSFLTILKEIVTNPSLRGTILTAES